MNARQECVDGFPIIGLLRAPQCRWCGEGLNDGYNTCPNCHRHQNSIIGRLQVFNIPSWAAIVVAVVAASFSWQQNVLVRTQVDEARQERLRAEDAVNVADNAAQAVKKAAAKAEAVENRIEREAREIRIDIMISERNRIRNVNINVRQDCREYNPAKLALQALVRELRGAYTSVEDISGEHISEENWIANCAKAISDSRQTLDTRDFLIDRYKAAGLDTAILANEYNTLNETTDRARDYLIRFKNHLRERKP